MLWAQQEVMLQSEEIQYGDVQTNGQQTCLKLIEAKIRKTLRQNDFCSIALGS